jgi:hypothetical protein
MEPEIVRLADCFRRLRAGQTWPGGHDAEAVEVIVSHRLVTWRWTEPCPVGATHWRPIAA